MEKGASDRVKSIGRDMVDQHTQLTDRLRTSASRENITLPVAEMTPEQKETVAQLEAKSGPEFDQAYLTDVTALQNQTIASFQNEAMHGQDPALSAFANQTLPMLNERARSVQRQIAPPM
jgi:putative membrane protein